MPFNSVELAVLVHKCLPLEESLKGAHANLGAARIMAEPLQSLESHVFRDCQTQYDGLRSQYNAQARRIIRMIRDHTPTLTIDARSYDRMGSPEYEMRITTGGSPVRLKGKVISPAEATACWISALMVKPELGKLQEKHALAESIAPSSEHPGYTECLVTVGSTGLWLDHPPNPYDAPTHLIGTTRWSHGMSAHDYKQALKDLGSLEVRGATIRLNVAFPHKKQNHPMVPAPAKV